MQDTATLTGHMPRPVNAYNAPHVPDEPPALPAPEGAGQGTADLPVPGRTYRATYSTDWQDGGRTTYQVQGVGAFELRAETLCYACGNDEQGRPRPCRHVEVTYGRGPRYTPQDQRQDLPVINRVTVVGGATMDPDQVTPGYFTAQRPRGPYRTEPVPDKTAARLGALVLALARHWAGLPEAPRMRAAAARALAARRYREAVAEQRDIRERIALERIELERAEAAASHQAALAMASGYEELVRLMQEPPAPRREFNVVGLCEGPGGCEPVVVAVTRGFVLSEADAVKGRGRTVCTAMVSASDPREAAEIFRRDHRERCGTHPTE